MSTAPSLDSLLSSPRTALVTGAAGFLGSHLAEKLLHAGWTVYGVDSFVTGQHRNIELLSPNANFHFQELELTDVPKLRAWVETLPQIDLMLHFASPASPPRYQAEPIITYQVNTVVTHELLMAQKEKWPDATTVFASTSEIYGDPEVHPQPESYWGRVNPNGPRSCYDEAKRLGETICGVFYTHFNVDVRMVRIFNTYGPRMDLSDGRIIPNLAGQALKGETITIYGDGSQTRSYCYVDDLVRGILLLGLTPGLAGRTVNIGNPEEYTVLETAKIIMAACGQPNLAIEHTPLPTDDPQQRQPDITLAREVLGWEPTVPFKEGLEKALAEFRTRV